ncbi:MAG: TonB-dependent receptor [Bacteroidia bacterium]|nr:TonB-dependent receptor [Bacteroidia bacterium]MBT8310414.1 TonB-dependent receptor [Bacteroidia bacterium]NNK28375.1 TonB-dependent receptor [Flavobacteriaceae bacterium]NNL59867.1 TonB-dependent receptor [Flavobacteriaceae bacterium]
MKSYIIHCFFGLFSLVLCAQEISIYNKTSKESIGGVAIYNVDKTKSVISDLDGKADISDFEENETIIFQHLSHRTALLVKSRILKNGNIVFLSGDSQYLEQVVISASKFEQKQKDVPQKILSLRASDIEFANPQTSADLLQNSGQVFIQKSQLGGGSPIIRGFSTNRLLLSIDGVRMNNAIFRGGNLQNVISIDPFSIQDTEIILGAGSVIYGSDAIGGVMNFYSKKPVLSYKDSVDVRGNASFRYASASAEKTGNVDLSVGFEKWGFRTNISYTDFDNLKMGKNGPTDYLRTEYVERINGEDIIVGNDDPLTQRFTGYGQINFMEKIRYEPNEKLNFNLGLHFSETSEYPRYDRLILYNDEGVLNSSEWNYGPQKWFLGNLQVNQKATKGIYDNAQFTLAYQNFQESRINRSFQSELRNITEENVDAFSLNLDFEKRISSINELFYGAEYIYNTIGSEGFEENINNGSSTNTISRYPDGSSWESLAAYLSYKYNPNESFTFQTGIRYNQIFIEADFTENNIFLDLPFNDASLKTGALTGTAGINWNPNKTLAWKLNFSTAFRAPNIDDIGKVFDSEPGSVVVPNPDLKSERSFGGELGLLIDIDDVLKLDLSTYYTYLDNALVRRDYTLNGQTEIEYNGELSTVQAIQNASEAKIHGFEAGLNIRITDDLELSSQYNIISGTEQEVGGATFPVRHVVPDFGNTHLIWQRPNLKLDFFTMYSGKLSFNELSLSERDKPYLYALDSDGNPYAPSWYTINLRSQYSFSSNFSLTASLENITNQRYRNYSSGIAAPGRNLILSARYNL